MAGGAERVFKQAGLCVLHRAECVCRKRVGDCPAAEQR